MMKKLLIDGTLTGAAKDRETEFVTRNKFDLQKIGKFIKNAKFFDRTIFKNSAR
jgi:hypothetical protein